MSKEIGFLTDHRVKGKTVSKIVYVTGCLGFIGYYVAKACLDKGWHVIGVDAETYAANPERLQDLIFAAEKSGSNFEYIRSDINDLTRLVDCDYVINTAAETHVDNSIESSDVFLRSNVNGVHNLLKLIQNKQYHMPILLHFSTDEVYGDIEAGAFTEEHLLKPSNPYSATKAAADQLITAWARTHAVPFVIVRPTNNYGAGQYTEKLIPKTVKYMQLGRKIPLHLGGSPHRTWLHVEDTADAITTIIEAGVVNEIYNIPGNYETSNLEVVKSVINELNDQFGEEFNIKDCVDGKYERPGADLRYSISGEKLAKLGWTAQRQFTDEIGKIVRYHYQNWIW